ncbi:TPA: hypothetical protein ACKP33_004076 [Serratia marcescens]|nr:hypothetical protein FG173_10135 [Serratia marcescens]
MKEMTIVRAAIITQNYIMLAVECLVLALAVFVVYCITSAKKQADLDVIKANFSSILQQEIARERGKETAKYSVLEDKFDLVLQQQRDLAIATETIKSKFSRENLSFQIKLSKFHEREISAFDEVYKKLTALKAASRLSLTPNDDNIAIFRGSVTKFRSVFDENRAWIHSNLAKSMEDLAIEIDTRVFQLQGLSRMASYNYANISDKVIKEAFERQDQHTEFIQVDVEEILRNLEGDIRRYLNPSDFC